LSFLSSSLPDWKRTYFHIPDLLGTKPHSKKSGGSAMLPLPAAEKNLYLTHARMRRVYGETMPTEPSRFLNEFPLELIEDLSRTTSWLGMRAGDPRSARRPATLELPRAPRENRFTGRTYNSVDARPRDLALPARVRPAPAKVPEIE
jgi:hypothetical protein